MKCSEAAENTYYEYKDVKFEENWRGALDNDFPVMVYHFFRGEKGSAEFDWFRKCSDAFMNDPRILGKTATWLDCEWKPQGQGTSVYANRAFGWCSLAEGTGYRQGIYSSPGLVPQLFPVGEDRWDGVWQWNAHWTPAPQDTLPDGWSEALRLVWQYGKSPTHSWTPAINGAGNTVDVNHLYFASVDDLRAWMGQVVSSPSPGPSPSTSASPSASPSSAPDCCDEHEIRINTLEANQSMLLTLTGQHEERIDVVESNITKIVEHTGVLADAIEQLAATDVAIAARVATLESSLQSLSERVDDQQSAINSNTAKVVEHNVKIDANSSAITGLRQEIVTLNQTLQDIKNSIP
jgi:hypothetical protein